MNPPVIKGFMPYGRIGKNSDFEPVMLHYEEYESLRLCDYDGLTHAEASITMGVSRPTFTRIYALARQKMAVALVEGRQLGIEGGKIYFDTDWFRCETCQCFFNNPEKDTTVEHCPLCKSSDVHNYSADNNGEPDDSCSDVNEWVCRVCGYKHILKQNEDFLLVCPSCKTSFRSCGRRLRGKF